MIVRMKAPTMVPGEAAAAAEQADAADHRRGDRGEDVVLADGRRAGAGLGGEVERRERREDAGQAVGEDIDPEQRDAGEERRFLVGAGGADGDAEARAPEPEPEQEEDDQDPDRGRQAEEDGIAEAHPAVGKLAAVGRQDEEGGAGQDRPGGERHQEGLQAEHRDEEPVDRADAEADGDDRDAPDRGRPPVVAELGGGDDGAERDHAADREIDAATQEHDGLAGGGEEKGHRRGGVDVELLEREDALAERPVDRDQHREHEAGDQERPAIDERGAPVGSGRAGVRIGHQCTLPSTMAALRMFSSEMALSSRTAAMRPFRSTATRSATWTSSGRSLE